MPATRRPVIPSPRLVAARALVLLLLVASCSERDDNPDAAEPAAAGGMTWADLTSAQEALLNLHVDSPTADSLWQPAWAGAREAVASAGVRLAGDLSRPL